MDIADTTRKFLRPLGYLKNGQYSDIIRFTCLRIICTISCLFIAIPAFWRIIFEVEVFSEKIKAILAFICGFTAFMFYVIILLQRQRILTMFDILQMIALARRTKNPTLNRIYKNANVNFVKLLQMCDIGMFRFSVPSFVLPIMIYSFFEYYGLQNSDESFQLAFSVAWVLFRGDFFEGAIRTVIHLCSRLPYNWRTPVAYFFTMIGQLVAFYFIAAVYIATFAMFFAICFYISAFFRDCDENLDRLEETIIDFTEFNAKQSITTLRRFRLDIHELIQFHCDAY